MNKRLELAPNDHVLIGMVHSGLVLTLGTFLCYCNTGTGAQRQTCIIMVPQQGGTHPALLQGNSRTRIIYQQSRQHSREVEEPLLAPNRGVEDITTQD